MSWWQTHDMMCWSDKSDPFRILIRGPFRQRCNISHSWNRIFITLAVWNNQFLSWKTEKDFHLRFHDALKIINVMFVYGVCRKGWNNPISLSISLYTPPPPQHSQNPDVMLSCQSVCLVLLHATVYRSTCCCGCVTFNVLWKWVCTPVPSSLLHT